MTSLQLHTEDGRVIEDPDAGQLRQVILSIQSDTTAFAILERDDERYMQVAPQGRGLNVVEYRDGGPQAHFRATDVPTDRVVGLFTAYASDDDGWRTALAWSPVQL